MIKKIYVMILVMLLLLTTMPLQPYDLKAEETDSISPEIASAYANSDNVGFGNNITITPTVTDDLSGVDLVKVNITFPDNSTGNFTMNNTGNSTYEYVFSDTWQTGQYNYTIWAVDNANNTNISSQYSFNVSAQATLSVSTIKDVYGDNEIINLTDPPGGSGGGSSSQLIGYELLDDGEVLRIWNRFDSYYFDTGSGIQLTNHYNDYWSHNVLMLGYYSNEEWNLIYRTDELSGFNKDIESDNETFVNATLWKDLSYCGYDFRLAIRYHLNVDDNELTVIPYIKNLGGAIAYTLGFGWEMKDIQIDMTTSGDYINVNRTMYYLNQTLDNVYTDLSEPEFYLMENITDTSAKSLYLSWNESLNYKLRVKSQEGQYNAPVSLFIKIGTLNEGQEKYTKLYWYDAEQFTYFFDSYDDAPFGEAWAAYPNYMVDGSLSNWASTTINGDVELCDENNCFGDDIGTISKVELRVCSYYSGGQRDTILRPVYGGTNDGMECHFSTSPSIIWSEWFDITYGPYAPQPWSWADVEGLDCDVVAENDPPGPTFTLYCCKVELRVTYIPYPPPEIFNPYPSNGSLGISISPTLNVTVSDPDGNNMNITWLSNSSGSWQVFGTNSSVVNGTYHQIMGNASENGKWWYWKVNVSDGISCNVSSVYKFYTGSQSLIKNTGSTNISGYLLIQVQCYSEPLDTWVSADYTINETTFRTINAGEQLALDNVFNGIVNSSNLPYGNGTYRVYVAFRDCYGNVLKCDNGYKLETHHTFLVTHTVIHGWYKLFKGDGFGKKSNFATRGTAIYNDELYIGTENHNFSNPLNLFCIGFPAGTRITMADGNYKNIEDIESGDVVKAYDIGNDSYVDANVTIVFNTSDWTPDYYLKFNDQLSVSPKHLLYVNGTLMRAEDAKVGDYLTDVNCSNVTINSAVNMTEKLSLLYNFGIALNGSEEPLFTINLTYFAEDVQVYPWVSRNIMDNPLVLEIPDSLLWLISVFLFIVPWGVSLVSDGCEVWKYSPPNEWTELIGDTTGLSDLPSGFGDHRTASVGDMMEFNGKLYVGTFNKSGCEIWRYDGSSWEQVVGKETSTPGDSSTKGFGNKYNYVAAAMEVFTNSNEVTHLYVGTINFDWSDNGFCQIWRTADGEYWYKVVDKGFRAGNAENAESDVRNAYVWDMEVFQGELYAGTFNIPVSDPGQEGVHRGCQLWKSDTGNYGDWEKVPIPGKHSPGYNDDNGFGEDKNYGIRKLVNWGDDLYVGVAASVLQDDTYNACEIWKYDGSDWTCIVGDDSEQSEPVWNDGFGDYYNKYLWSMAIVDNVLWAGTLHHHFIYTESGLPWPDSKGCEVWYYDGTELKASVEDDKGEKPNGFADEESDEEWWNRGTRSLIEYPSGSGKVVVGTLTFRGFGIKEEIESCEVWVRYP